jgi:ribosomal protein S18 acetylase RimI-like enzyme
MQTEINSSSHSTFDTRLQVRLARRDDLPALEWEGEFIHFRNLYTDTFRRMELGHSLMWVADMPTIGLIGQLFVSLLSTRSELSDGKNRAYIYGFRVRPLYRNQGVGSLLISTAEDDLKLRGYSHVTLNVARDNPGALRLYKRYGYRIMGFEPGIWSYIDHLGRRCEVNEPAWRMEKSLLD